MNFKTIQESILAIFYPYLLVRFYDGLISYNFFNLSSSGSDGLLINVAFVLNPDPSFPNLSIFLLFTNEEI